MNRENEMDRNNIQPVQNDKDRKYSDEGRDGDYNNNPDRNGPDGPSVSGGDERYEDEQGTGINPFNTSNEKKSEEESYVSYDGNADNTPPSR